MRSRIDLNCDVGESFGDWRMGADAELLPHASSANIACGFHAGDPMVMHRTVALCVRHGVAIGAHPGWPDLQGFGRRALAASPAEAYAFVLYQISALAGFVGAAGARLQHVKPHGALYNQAARDRSLADAIAAAVRDVDPQLRLYGLAGSELQAAALAHGLQWVAEAFVERAYEPDGSLVARSLPGAVLEDPGAIESQVLGLLARGEVAVRGGGTLRVDADTLCLHGDRADAVALAQRLRRLLAAAGVEVSAP
ncbi:MAG: LamB/YcsF family protein [Aquimonas sp.]|nr:LamB/YcsF family protein [Aquimonas sp.]